MKEPWIQLVNGKAFEPYNCTKDDIDIEVIASALSNICRFSGHTKRFYSVAEHSVHVSNLLPDDMKIYGLLHDAHEAYTGYGDVCNPVKSNELKFLEKNIDWEIARHFGLDIAKFYYPSIKEADLTMLSTEKEFLLEPSERDWDINLPDYIRDMPLMGLRGDPEVARSNFLDAYRRLTNGTN